MAKSTYSRDAVLAWFRGTTYPAVPGTVYISLHSADPGATGANELAISAGYTRKAVSANTSEWTAPADGSGNRFIENVNPITFATASGDWVTATHFGVWDDDETGPGNYLRGSALTTPRTVINGTTAEFAAGDLTIAES